MGKLGALKERVKEKLRWYWEGRIFFWATSIPLALIIGTLIGVLLAFYFGEPCRKPTIKVRF